jgi:hypothetical protein
VIAPAEEKHQARQKLLDERLIKPNDSSLGLASKLVINNIHEDELYCRKTVASLLRIHTLNYACSPC